MISMSSYVDVSSLNDETPNYDELMTRYAPLVKRIAYHLMGRLPSNIQLDNMVQTGMIGLFEALKAYDMSKGASFETYARIRIRGSMLDEVRLNDWTPRSVYRKSREISEAVHNVEAATGRDAKDSEVAEALDISVEEYYKMVKDAAGCQVLSYEEMTSVGGNQDEASVSKLSEPYRELQEKDFKEGLASKISGLPEREQLVMALYYYEELNLREIGEVLDVTEGRVCQIHAQALVRLRSRMKDWLDDEDGE